MKKICCIVCVLCYYSCALQAHELFIIVPGTWAIKESWYKIGGDFFTALQESISKSNKNNNKNNVLWFRWLSGNQEKDRYSAAQELAHMFECFEPSTDITIIAHSHGVNVALGACQLLAQSKSPRKIKTLFALAAPIYEEQYKPNMRVIGRLYNLYSLNDAIQTIWGYSRIFTPQPGILNLQVFLEGKEPNHSDIHSPIIGKWLTYLAKHPCPTPGTVHFTYAYPPEIRSNPDCEKQLTQDKPIEFQTLLDFRKKVKNNTLH